MYNLAAQPVALVTRSLPLPQLDAAHIPSVSVWHQDTLYHKLEVKVKVAAVVVTLHHMIPELLFEITFYK
jgi:hypothetical protein